ncbi:zinc ribbon domain-containing protein [Gordonia hydrophobica]|uniref:C4-type zinc ribbon domain-containing protein n=1 Tax=Gordonia hydrophobica TaxID=40516 RepID=A0ABZ2TYE4_9ACTN|nr:C4-type zinc ribbon domain-containing protein [Gordonia hydrophobica]MBM7367040.1 putative nucleic acid-binding Zn-ribbon protein [Gordonia hydrophobica]
MKVPNAQQRRLLDLADLDAEIAKANHERRNLPEDAELAKLAEQLETLRDDRAKAQVAVDNLQAEYDRVDTELTGTTKQLRSDQEAIDAGLVSHKVLTELQHEATGLQRRSEVLETELLEVMEQQEATDAEVERTEAALLHATEQDLEWTAKRDAAVVAIEERITDLSSKRTAAVDDVDEALTAVYERLRGQGRVGAGLVRQRRCGACRMEMDPRTLSRIAAADDDEVLFCDECGAVMVRTDQSGLPKPAAAE